MRKCSYMEKCLFHEVATGKVTYSASYMALHYQLAATTLWLAFGPPTLQLSWTIEEVLKSRTCQASIDNSTHCDSWLHHVYEVVTSSLNSMTCTQ